MTQIIHLSDVTFNEIADELIRTGREDAVILEKDRSISLSMHGICILRKAANVVDFPSGKITEEAVRIHFMMKGFE